MDRPTIFLAFPGDPGRLQTEYIQAALDQCRDFGGGEVVLARGRWHIGSLRLYSNTTLRLSTGT